MKAEIASLAGKHDAKSEAQRAALEKAEAGLRQQLAQTADEHKSAQDAPAFSETSTSLIMIISYDLRGLQR